MRSSLAILALSLSTIALACSAETAADDAEVPVGEPESEESELVRGSVMIDADDDGKTIAVNQNQKFSIKLSQTASAGYRWSVKTAGGFGEAERRSVGPRAGSVGGSSTEYFSWNVGTKTGTHTVELIYKRAWETTTERSFKVKIDIQNAVSGRCGGIAGLRCKGGEWCNFTTSTCGRFDQMGRCEERPRGCRMNHDPVCGCNYRTYSNSCLAKAAGVDVNSEGSCPN